MGKIDNQTRDYVSNPTVFADLFNYLIYGGKCVIQPDELRELDATEVFIPFDKNGKAYPTQKFRDVLKSVVLKEDNDAAYALILGVENQTSVNYAMPVRNMAYDAYNYISQVSAITKKHKAKKDNQEDAGFLSGMKLDDKLTPVITLVLHFGQEPWDAPMSVHEMFETQNPDIMRFVPDYKINLISPVSMSDAELEKFVTDFRDLARFIKCGRDKKALRELVENNDGFKHMNLQTANLANDLTNAKLDLSRHTEGEINMCVAIEGIREDARAEGRLEGRLEGIAEGRAEGIVKGIAEGIVKGKAEGKAEGRAEGRAEGKTTGENLILTLINKMIAAGRIADLARVSNDKDYRLGVMREFGLA